MSKTGKVGKGAKDMGLAKRHQGSAAARRDPLCGITKPAIRRLARRGGITRVSTPVQGGVREMLRIFLLRLIHDAVTYVEHSRRKTVTLKDVQLALERRGIAIYGVGEPSKHKKKNKAKKEKKEKKSKK